MKPISEMTRLELAAFISTELRKQNIDVVLSGGACVSIYSHDKYVSMDLDFIDMGLTKRSLIRRVMESLGFTEKHRYFQHPGTDLFVEFPPGPLGVGDEAVRRIDEITTDTGMLRIISPTDCVKDRLAWYYNEHDRECLKQAILVASVREVDRAEIKRWSEAEGKRKDYEAIKDQLWSSAGA